MQPHSTILGWLRSPLSMTRKRHKSPWKTWYA